MRSKGSAILNLAPPQGMSVAVQRQLLDTLREYNTKHRLQRIENSNLSARIASYELAYKMQEHAPEAVDLASETAETRRLYGLDQPKTAVVARQCLLARRLVERGVRFVQSEIRDSRNRTSRNGSPHRWSQSGAQNLPAWMPE